MTKEELEDDIYKLQKQYIKMKPKSIHRNPHYAEGCAWAHFNSCSLYQRYIYHFMNLTGGKFL